MPRRYTIADRSAAKYHEGARALTSIRPGKEAADVAVLAQNARLSSAYLRRLRAAQR